jgi:hypothetical protein
VAPRCLDEDPLKEMVTVSPKAALVRRVRRLVVRRAEATVGDHLPHVMEPLNRSEEGGQRHRGHWTDPGDGPEELRLTRLGAGGFELLLEGTEEPFRQPSAPWPVES